MEKLLSISVAAYNVEKYIKQTLDSFCIPEVLPYIEVFVVDDGGKDSTLSIAREYESRYPDSFIAVHKENGGWGSTVNYSIEHATGKYFRLCDGDDYYDKEGLITLIETMKFVTVDVIYTPYRRFDDETGKTVEKFSAKDGCPKNKKVHIAELNELVDFVMHSSSFRTEILQKNNVRVLEHCFYTDNEYRARGMAYAETAYILEMPVYQYRVGREGQSVDIAGLKKHYKDNLSVLKELVRFTKSIKGNNNYGLLLKYTKSVAQFQYEALVRLGFKDEIKDFDLLLKNYGPEFYETNNAMVLDLRKKNFSTIKFYTKYLQIRNAWASKIKILLNDR